MKIPEQRTENRQARSACRTHNKGGYIMKTYRIECVNLKKDWKSGHVGTTVKTGFAEVKKFMYPLKLHYVRNGEYWTAFNEIGYQY